VVLGFKELDERFAHLRRSHFFGHSFTFDFYGTNLATFA